MNGEIDKNMEVIIRNLYHDDEGGKAFFDWAANRVNDAAETSVDRIMQIAEVDRWKAIELIKNLCDAGLGEYIVGRKGWKTRVRWKYSLRSIGKTASGDNAKLEGIDPELAEDVSDQAAISPLEASPRSRLTIADAKRQLADSLGVRADAIEILIRA